MLERSGRLAPWRLRAVRRAGVCACWLAHEEGESAIIAILDRAAAHRLAGIAVLSTPGMAARLASVARRADGLGLFLVAGASEARSEAHLEVRP